MELLRARLMEAQRERAASSRANDRRSQIGSGMRADKRRTIRVQDGSVVDHILGKQWNLKDYMKGNW